MSKSTKDILSFLFLESAQADADELNLAENLEQIFEAAAQEEGDLKTEKTPLVKALAQFGITDADLQMDPEGFCLVTDNHQRYMDAMTVLGSADAMHKLAEMGWVVTKPGDNAMTNEPPSYRIRFLEITTVDQNDREPKGGTYDTSNREEVIKKAQKFATTPMDRDDDDLNPVEGDTGKPDKLQKGTKRKGVGEPKDGKEAEKAIHDAIQSGDVDKLLEMTTTGSMGTVDAPMLPTKMLNGPQYEPAEGIIKKPKPYGKGTAFHMPGQWKVKQPIVKQQVKRHPHSEALETPTCGVCGLAGHYIGTLGMWDTWECVNGHKFGPDGAPTGSSPGAVNPGAHSTLEGLGANRTDCNLVDPKCAAKTAEAHCPTEMTAEQFLEELPPSLEREEPGTQQK